MHMKKILWTAAVLSLTVTASAAMASNGGPALTHFISYTNTGFVYVYFDATAVTNVPACGQGNLENRRAYGCERAKTSGKAVSFRKKAAHSAGEGVWVSGTGDCGVVAGN